MAEFKLDFEQSASGLDAFFASEPAVISPHGQAVTAAKKPARIKVGSLHDLNGFVRASADTLVHKSTNDLWALRQEGEGYFIERLFNDTGSPLKG
jgi:hypothetical protein